MRLEIFLPQDLQDIIDQKASSIGISSSALIVDQLHTLYKDELNNVLSKSYSQLYSELRESVIQYKNALNPNDTFTLHDIPYYQSLGVVSSDGKSITPSTTRARLGRSINKEISSGSSNDFLNVERETTKSGKLAFRDGAAVYRIK